MRPITLIVHLCVQHDVRDAGRRADPSAAAETQCKSPAVNGVVDCCSVQGYSTLSRTLSAAEVQYDKRQSMIVLHSRQLQVAARPIYDTPNR